MLIRLDQYERTADLLAAVQACFDKGASHVDLVRGGEFFSTLLSPRAAKMAVTESVARQWAKRPEILADLEKSLGETPEEF
jgi:hypothetical protein